MNKASVERAGRVVEDPRFGHVMAISLDPSSRYMRGVLRCITSRLEISAWPAYIDRSELHLLSGDSLEHFTVGEKLSIRNADAVVKELGGDALDFIGLEDPDIWIDDKTGLLHLYFTMTFIGKDGRPAQCHLGHAVGKDLDSLEMTPPVLRADASGMNTAKEVSIAPVNSKGVRYNLFESNDKVDEIWYSTIRVGIAEDMQAPWESGEVAFHPRERGIAWAGRHASPGPLFSRRFIDVGEGRVLGIMNGREADHRIGDTESYGTFSVGLFIYDYENGKIDWVSPEPIIVDSEAQTITFASQFVETRDGEGILYAHVDDSFVRAYTLNAETLKPLLPINPHL
jgi:hypothetical protein